MIYNCSTVLFSCLLPLLLPTDLRPLPFYPLPPETNHFRFIETIRYMPFIGIHDKKQKEFFVVTE
ncbi:MAG: hypothetical protein C4B58_05880 [Deltaproteobacteria bacterium]|nr:MAG: hypothetical protein C4B58_05880 [Deltaproteobacteria bacterium]